MGRVARVDGSTMKVGLQSRGVGCDQRPTQGDGFVAPTDEAVLHRSQIHDGPRSGQQIHVVGVIKEPGEFHVFCRESRCVGRGPTRDRDSCVGRKPPTGLEDLPPWLVRGESADEDYLGKAPWPLVPQTGLKRRETVGEHEWSAAVLDNPRAETRVADNADPGVAVDPSADKTEGTAGSGRTGARPRCGGPRSVDTHTVAAAPSPATRVSATAPARRGELGAHPVAQPRFYEQETGTSGRPGGWARFREAESRVRGLSPACADAPAT